MTALDLFKQRLSLLRPFLSTGSIDEKMIELLKPILDEIITFIALPIFDEHNFSEIQRVTTWVQVINATFWYRINSCISNIFSERKERQIPLFLC